MTAKGPALMFVVREAISLISLIFQRPQSLSSLQEGQQLLSMATAESPQRVAALMYSKSLVFQ